MTREMNPEVDLGFADRRGAAEGFGAPQLTGWGDTKDLVEHPEGECVRCGGDIADPDTRLGHETYLCAACSDLKVFKMKSCRMDAAA